MPSTKQVWIARQREETVGEEKDWSKFQAGAGGG